MRCNNWYQTGLTAILVATTFSCGPASSIAPCNMSVEAALKRIQAGDEVPADLEISYDDMHGLWGGTTIVITGKEKGERRDRDRGSPKPEIFERFVRREQLLELVKLLIEQKAWEQRTPNRDPLADESRASLTIKVNGQTSRIWEWFNDMEKNERLIKIKLKMKQLTN